MSEEEGDECGDASKGDAGAAESGGGVIERAGVLAVAEKQYGEDREWADESEELKPLPLGEEPVIAGFLRGDDCGGFGWSKSLKHCRKRERREARSA